MEVSKVDIGPFTICSHRYVVSIQAKGRLMTLISYYYFGVITGNITYAAGTYAQV
ncbi:hypothetical protein [Oribacterium sp. P6A1]|uniref:hypothetical protein n=1 Tax=Oribacterium sp. P6A1 TaxID=1410612 RepID=UPI000A8E7B38|nr:hypothetical protein [Oribacterium sp. P6A1]